MKKVCPAQELHCAEYADSMERCNMEERNRQYRSLKMQAVGAWLLAVPLLLLSIFGNYVSYGSEIQLPLAALALLFLGTSFCSTRSFRTTGMTRDFNRTFITK